MHVIHIQITSILDNSQWINFKRKGKILKKKKIETKTEWLL